MNPDKRRARAKKKKKEGAIGRAKAVSGTPPPVADGDARLDEVPFECAYQHPGQLAHSGPVISVMWSVPKAQEEMLLSLGRPVPDPVGGVLLIDTGARNTCIATYVAERLGLLVTRMGKGFGAGGEHENPVYRARLTMLFKVGTKTIGFTSEDEVSGIPAMDSVSDALGLRRGASEPMALVGLLGRNLMSHMRLTYDGRTGRCDGIMDLRRIRRS